mgnify:CR=1 FL=1
MNLVFVDLSAIAIAFRQACLGGFNQFIGENEIGISDIGKGYADKQFVAALFRIVDVKANFAFVVTFKVATETLAANVTRNSFLPFHPGAVRYYREIGIKIPDSLVPTN